MRTSEYMLKNIKNVDDKSGMCQQVTLYNLSRYKPEKNNNCIKLFDNRNMHLSSSDSFHRELGNPYAISVNGIKTEGKCRSRLSIHD